MNQLDIFLEQLQDEWGQLESAWAAASSQWNDVARHRFEREFMGEYESTIHAALKEIDSLTQVIAQAAKQVR